MNNSPSWSYFVEDQNEWFVEGSSLWPVLLTGYSFVFLVGVVGNVLLLFALYGSGGSRRARALPVRNHLMVNLAAADLFVTAVCVPISACAAASHPCWPNFLVSWMCQLSPILQKTPVAASTLSLALLSLDRWAAFRHPRFAQRFREKRFVVMSMVSIWILASLVSAPNFWARQWEARVLATEATMPTFDDGHTPPPPEGHAHGQGQGQSSPHEDSWQDDHQSNHSGSSSGESSWSGICLEKWTNLGLEIAYVATYLGTAFISPALIVAACHASVSQKLTSQLKVSGAGAGPGPAATLARGPQTKSKPHKLLPIKPHAHRLRRPKHVLIVSHDPNNAVLQHGNREEPGPRPAPNRKIIPCDPDSDDDYLQLQIQAELESFRQISQQIKLSVSSAQKTQRRISGGGGGSSGLFRSLHPNSYYRPPPMQIQVGVGGRSQSHSHSSLGLGLGLGLLPDEVGVGVVQPGPSAAHLAFIDSSGLGLEPELDRERRDSIPSLIFEQAVEGGGGGYSKPIRAGSIIRQHRRTRKKLLSHEKKVTGPVHVYSMSILPTYSSQSFRSRRRAANLMAALAIVFVLCWLPYVICTIWELCTMHKTLVRFLLPFALFLGHAHSAINPVVSWRLNRSAFVRFQKKSFFSSLVPDLSCLRSARLGLRSAASCRYYCCTFTGNSSCCCCANDFDMRSEQPTIEPRWTGTGPIFTQQPLALALARNARTGTARQSLAGAIQHRHRNDRPPMNCCGRLKKRFYCSCWRSCRSQSHSPGQHYSRRHRRRTSSPDGGWNTSTNEAALGAFHPKYLSRLPVQDPISRCHTSHFLR